MIYITYNNKAHTDGAGAQLQRILSIYLCSLTSKNVFGIKIGYVHSPLIKLDYQGLQCLESNTEDNSLVDKYNQLFNLPSDQLPNVYDILEVSWLKPQVIQSLRNHPRDILVKATYAHDIIDSLPTILKQKIPLDWVSRSISSPLQIAVHVRRGELMVVEASRMLPNSYYIECLQALYSLLSNYNIPFEIHLHTEVPTKAFDVTPTHHGILERINTNVKVDPADNKLDEFSVIPNIHYHINEDPIETLKALTNSDILLASRSSFSYIAGILKNKGTVLFHPFWHALSPDWIPIQSSNDIILHTNLILKSILL